MKPSLRIRRASLVRITEEEERKMKRTFQPHVLSRKRSLGFRARMATHGGRRVLNNRRRIGRKRLAL